jgi:hypothetical protein
MIRLSVTSTSRQAGSRPLSFERQCHPFDQALLFELARRYIDRDRDRRQARVLPGLVLAARRHQHPFADGDNQAAFFGQADEAQRRNDAVLGMLPADQRFDPDDQAGAQVDLGLVQQVELAFVERAAQAFEHDQLLLDLAFISRV